MSKILTLIQEELGSDLDAGVAGINSLIQAELSTQTATVDATRPPPEERTNLMMTPEERAAERRAATEFKGRLREFDRMGVGEDFKTFVQAGGEEPGLGALGFDTIVDPIFDLISGLSYATAGTVQELLRANSDSTFADAAPGTEWAKEVGIPPVILAFSQGARELGSALPFVTMEGAREPDFIDVFADHGYDNWAAWTAGLAATMVIDPINLIPLGALVVGPKTLAKRAKEVPAVGSAFKKMFSLSPELDVLGDDMAEQLMDLERKFGTESVNETLVMLDRVDELVAEMDWVQRRMFAAYMDNPKRLESELRILAADNIIPMEKVPELMARTRLMHDFTVELFLKEVNAPLGGLLDPNSFRKFYLTGMEAVTPQLERAFKNVPARQAATRQSRSPLPGRVPGFTKPKSYRYVADRITASLTGDLSRTTELDIGNILKMRAIEHVRAMTTRKLQYAVLDNPNLATRVDASVEQMNNAKKWNADKKILLAQKSMRDFDLYEVVQKFPGPLEIAEDFTEKIIGAYILPKPIAKFLKRSDAALQNPEGLERLLVDYYDPMMELWRGYATMGTGFHARNALSMMNSNWMQGVGTDYGAILVKGKWEVPGKFGLRYLQALKVMAAAMGGGRMPKGLRDKAEALSKRWGFLSFDNIPDVAIKGAKGPLSYREIAQLGEKFGVPQTATKLFNVDDGLPKAMWNEFEETVDVLAKVDDSGAAPLTKEILSLGVNENRTLGEWLTKTIGGDSKLMRAHRAVGQMIENQGRWAMFIDQLAKGVPAEFAAKQPRLWHFDYRMLSQAEKQGARRMMPFYAWQRFAAPRMVMAMLENPARMSRMPKLQAAIEKLSPEWEGVMTPDYYDEVRAIQLPFIDEDFKDAVTPDFLEQTPGTGKPMSASLDFPVLELNRFNMKDIMSSMTPVIKLFWEEGTNHDLFLDTELERFPGEEGKAFPELFSKSAEHNIQTLFPPIGKFVFRPTIAHRRGELEELLVSELIGVRLKSIDERRVMLAKTHALNKMSREFKKKLQQDKNLRESFPWLGKGRERERPAPASPLFRALDTSKTRWPF